MIGGYGEKVPGLAVIVYKNGKEVYRNMMGNRFLSPRKKNWNLPVTSDSRFRVASISKVFTATGYMQLVEEGRRREPLPWFYPAEPKLSQQGDHIPDAAVPHFVYPGLPYALCAV